MADPIDVPTIRSATAAHLPGVKAIYDHQVLHSTSTFDLEPPALDYWAARMETAEPAHHLLVAIDDGAGPKAVLGYAYSASYRPRPAYARTRETSVYLAEGSLGRGIGRRLYDELLRRLRADGIHTVLAVIAKPNPASEALHRACGFEPVGVLPEVGFKHGRWIDTGLWALHLDVGTDDTGLVPR